jgi:hypothetical protein
VILLLDGDGEESSPVDVHGDRTGKIPPRRDGNGGLFPDGEFSIAIFIDYRVVVLTPAVVIGGVSSSTLLA